MQVMGLFDAIPKKNKNSTRVVVLLTCVGLVLSLSGCAKGTMADWVIPDVNKEQMLLTDGNLVEYNFDDGSRIIYSGTLIRDPVTNLPTEGGVTFPDSGNSGGATESGLKSEPVSYDRPVVDTDFEKPTGFWDYEVLYPYFQDGYLKISDFLAGKSDVYFRVFAAGTTQIRETKTVYDDGRGQSGDIVDRTLVASTVYDRTYNPGNLSSLGGTTIDRFLYQWLSPLDVNKDCHNISATAESYVANLDRLIGNVNNGGAITYEQVTETFNSPITKQNLGTVLMEMWSRVKEEAPTLGEFRDLVSLEPERVLLDITLEYYTAWNVRKSVVLNPYSKKTLGATSTLNTSSANVDVAFCSYNQFNTRSSSDAFNYWGVWGVGVGRNSFLIDESSMLYCYVDGYNKYLAYLAVADGKTFEDVFTAEELAYIKGSLNTLPGINYSGYGADGWDYSTKWIVN